MEAVGRALFAADVSVIYLVHGSFVGADAFGLLREITRFVPAAGDPLRRIQKQLLDAVAKDAGNYTREFAEAFETDIALAGESHIPVRLFNWSSENHHIGRADGAVRLLGRLFDDEAASAGRVLVWSHSHGGNVLALLTNLLGADATTRERFFDACRPYYKVPVLNTIDMPEWARVETILSEGSRKEFGTRLDLATFGTPVRYGWETEGFGHLLHFIYHRPVPGKDETIADFPGETDDVLHAKYGDFIQQIGIAGTNFAPALWAWRAGRADRQLGKLLQPNLRTRDLLDRFKLRIRTHEDGTNLLVDYGQPEGNVAQHIAGHAVYTRQDWLLFHAEQVASRFYGLTATNADHERRT